MPHDPSVVGHFVAFFRAYGPEEFFNLMRDRPERGESLQFEVGTRVIVDEAFEIALADYRRHLTRVSSQQPQAGQLSGDLVSTRVEPGQDTVMSMLVVDNIAESGQGIPNRGTVGVDPAAMDPVQPTLEHTANDIVLHDWLFDPDEVYTAFDNYGAPPAAVDGYGEQWAATLPHDNEYDLYGL